MVERWWDSSSLGQDPRYQKYADEIIVLEQLLFPGVDQDGKANLTHLLDAYARREDVVAQLAFAQGFSTAVLLLLDVLKCEKRRSNRFDNRSG